jgi:hypothetical protein
MYFTIFFFSIVFGSVSYYYLYSLTPAPVPQEGVTSSKRMLGGVMYSSTMEADKAQQEPYK